MTTETHSQRRTRILAEFDRVCSSSHRFHAAKYASLAVDLDSLAAECTGETARKFADRAEECRAKAQRVDIMRPELDAGLAEVALGWNAEHGGEA
jgi:hypothetical protein